MLGYHAKQLELAELRNGASSKYTNGIEEPPSGEYAEHSSPRGYAFKATAKAKDATFTRG